MIDMCPAGDKDQRSRVTMMVRTTTYDKDIFSFASFLAKHFTNSKWLALGPQAAPVHSTVSSCP